MIKKSLWLLLIGLIMFSCETSEQDDPIQEVLQLEEPSALPIDGELYRLKLRWEGLYLNGANSAGTLTAMHALNTDWWSQQWYLEKVPGTSNVFRIKCRWDGLYLASTNVAGDNLRMQNLNTNWWSQQWIITEVPGQANTYRMQCRWGQLYVNGSNQVGGNPTVLELNNSWWSQQWIIESVGGSNPNPNPTPTTQKIMPMGDSFTFGTIDNPVGNEATYGGYRHKLYDLLTANGKNFDFVGPQSMGDFSSDNQNAGFPGAVSDKRKVTSYPSWSSPSQVQDMYSNIDNWMDTYNPDIILMMIGINDVFSGFGISNQQAALAQEQIWDRIYAKNPNAIIFVGRNEGMPTLNSELEPRVQSTANSGREIYLVDPHAGWNNSTMKKGNHPNILGYDTMGQNWYNIIKDFL